MVHDKDLLPFPQPTRYNQTYAIVEAKSAQDLCSQVSSLLAQGFQPLGGISAIGSPDPKILNGLHLYQALLKIEPAQEIPQPAEPTLEH